MWHAVLASAVLGMAVSGVSIAQQQARSDARVQEDAGVLSVASLDAVALVSAGNQRPLVPGSRKVGPAAPAVPAHSLPDEAVGSSAQPGAAELAPGAGPAGAAANGADAAHAKMPEPDAVASLGPDLSVRAGEAPATGARPAADAQGGSDTPYSDAAEDRIAEEAPDAEEAGAIAPEPEPLLGPMRNGMRSQQVRRLQVRLRHARSYARFNVDGAFGPVTEDAVRKFQRAQGLPVTGVVDQATWDRLLEHSSEPSDAELSNTDIGPWFVEPDMSTWMMELQHRLQQVGVYQGPVDGDYNQQTRAAIAAWRARIGQPESEIMDERSWTWLIERTRNPSYAQLFDAPPAVGDFDHELDPRCTTGKVVCISKQQQRISYVVDGEVRMTRDARFAMPGMESPEGDFRIWYMNRDTVSKIFGERFPMPQAFFYQGNVAVHFSQDFASNGYDGGSHGCSQLRDYQAAKWLYEQVRVGDRVVVY